MSWDNALLWFAILYHVLAFVTLWAILWSYGFRWSDIQPSERLALPIQVVLWPWTLYKIYRAFSGLDPEMWEEEYL